jgi:acylphosphatase
VFFRKYTKLEADKLGIVGIVRNMEDGSVQGVAQGTEANVKRMYFLPS